MWLPRSRLRLAVKRLYRNDFGLSRRLKAVLSNETRLAMDEFGEPRYLNKLTES
jgi:hypothetical protein